MANTTPRCGTVVKDPQDEPCLKVATHMVRMWNREDEVWETEPSCLPCAEAWLRRPSLKATVEPIASGDEHNAGDPYFEWFDEVSEEKRIERIVLLLVDSAQSMRYKDVLRALRVDTSTIVPTTAQELVKRRLMVNIATEDDVYRNSNPLWQLTVGGARLADEIREQAEGYARVAFTDRPVPEFVNTQYSDTAQHVGFYYTNLVNESGSRSFATWTTSSRVVTLYSAEGQVKDVLGTRYVEHHVPSESYIRRLAATWGPVDTVVYSERRYPSE